MSLPLLIGGATTSAAHTAIKIAPHYSGPIIHVLDASHVPVVTSLMGEEKRESFISNNEIKHNELRLKFGTGEANNKLIPIEVARDNALSTEWDHVDISKPVSIGVKEVYPQINELIPFIDWSPFFHAWEIRGRYPSVFDNPKFGEEAKKLFDDTVTTKENTPRKYLQAKGIWGCLCKFTR